MNIAVIGSGPGGLSCAARAAELGLSHVLLEAEDHPSHTIYLHVPTRSPFNELTKELKVVKSLTKVPDHDPHFINEPHLLIAQKLKPFQFTRMWMDCEHTQFTGRFMANSMVLLKRSLVSNQYT